MPEVTLGSEFENAAVDLSLSGTANSYIVSESGSYKFTPTKGNSTESVGAIGLLYLWGRKDPFLGSSSSTTWYPASGLRNYGNGGLTNVSVSGFNWSVTPDSDNAYRLGFASSGTVDWLSSDYRANGYAVRCIQVTD